MILLVLGVCCLFFFCSIGERSIGQTRVMQQFKNNSLVKVGVSLKYRSSSSKVLPTFLSAASASTDYFSLLLSPNCWPVCFLGISFQCVFLQNKFHMSVKFGAVLKQGVMLCCPEYLIR